MEQSFHYQLMAVQSFVQKKILEQLSDTDLTIGQPKVLEYLGHHDGMSQKDIAQACHIEPGSMTSILNRMKDKKMIERRMLHGNRRSFYVFLTPYGKEMWQRVDQAFARIEQEIWQDISADEQEHFMKTFHQIYNNLAPKY
jgi:DNA-binding MarR family transcriptional regulator